MANLGKTEDFQPMYYYQGEPLVNKHLVKHMFDKMKEEGKPLIVNYHNDPLTIKVRVKQTYGNFVLLVKRVITDTGVGEIPFTISYAEVIAQDVKIKGKERKLQPWVMSVPVEGIPKALLKNS